VQTFSSIRTALIPVLLVGLFALPSCPGRTACGDPGVPYAEVQISTQPRVNLQLARTEPQRQQGLMFVDNLAPDSGMLFVYDSPSRESYWMYHTLIPLSIAWIDRDGTILDIQDMPRLNDPNDVQEASRTVYTPAVAPYWYALEVNQGWFVNHGVGVGQQFSFCLDG
jgi:uncharacterized protein